MANQWDKKYFREQPFMAFGSMMNAFSQMNQQKGKTIDEFKKEAEELFDLSIKLTIKAEDNASKDTTQLTNEEPTYENR